MPPVDVVQPGSDPRFQSALDEDELVLVHPPAIPIPPTSVENLSTALSSLRSAASEISQAGQDIKSTWQGLQNHYSAPEAEDLFAALNPVETTGDQVHDDLYDVVSALKTFVGTAHRTQQRLRQLRDDAWDLVDEADGDPEWNSDRALAARNGALKRAVNRQWALFQEAERECGNTIRDVCGLSGDYTAASGDGAPGPNDIVWGIDPADVADPGYDLTKWDDWKRMWEDNNHYARNADMPWPLDWTRDAYYAQWDNFGGGMVWGLGVSAVSATGAWSQEGGWASSWGEAKDNAIAHQEEKIQGLGALAGLYGEDGWMNPFSGPEAWNWDGDAWQANAGAAWTEVAHEFVPWREWEDRPAYTVYTGLGNAALTVVAFPVRGGTLLAKLGGGGLNDLGGTGGPDGLSPGALSTHWPNGVGGRPGFSLSEHLSNATGRPWGTGTDLSTRLNELRTDLAARFGTFTAVDGAPNEGSPTRAGHGTGDPSDGHVPQADGLEGSSSPNRAPSPTGTPDRTKAEEERQARELAEEVAEVERYSNEEYLRQRAEQPVLVGAGDGPMEINGRTDTTITNSSGDGDSPSLGGRPEGDRVTIREDSRTGSEGTTRDRSGPPTPPFGDGSGNLHGIGESKNPEPYKESYVPTNGPDPNTSEPTTLLDKWDEPVEFGSTDASGRWFDEDGVAHIEKPDKIAHAKAYSRIRNANGDIDVVSELTGIRRDVVDRIKNHIFHKDHEVAVGPNDVRSGKFTPMWHISDWWEKAMNGRAIPDSEQHLFRRWLEHEAIESKLMEWGMPYNSSHQSNWHWDDIWEQHQYSPNSEYYGAHDVSRSEGKPEPYGHYREDWKKPDIEPNEDLSNIEEIARSIFNEYRKNE